MLRRSAQVYALPEYSDDGRWLIEHDIPGRLRIKAVEKDWFYPISARLQGHMLERDGILSVKTGSRTGSLTFRYDCSLLDREQVLIALQAMIRQKTPLALAVDRGGDELKQKAIRRLLLQGAGIAMFPLFPMRFQAALALALLMPVMKKGLNSLMHGEFSTSVLESTGVVLAIVTGSSKVLVLSHLMSELALFFQTMAQHDTEKLIHSLTDNPDVSVQVLQHNVWSRAGAEAINQGDIVEIQAGEKIPFDGLVLEGHGVYDDAAMMALSSLEDVRPGRVVEAGGQLIEGEMTILALSQTSNSSQAEVLRGVDKALSYSQHAQDYATELSMRMAPVNLAFAGAVYMLTQDTGRTAALLQMDYTESIQLLAPLVIESALYTALKHGVLFCRGQSFDSLAMVDTIVIERSGGYSQSLCRVTQLQVVDSTLEQSTVIDTINRLLLHDRGVADALDSVADYLQDQSCFFIDIYHAQRDRLNQRGIHLHWQGKLCQFASAEVLCGMYGDSFIEDQAPGHVFYLVIDKQVRAKVICEEPGRSELAQTVWELKRSGVKKVILVSAEDMPSSAELQVYQQQGIDHCYFELDDQEKSALLRQLRDVGSRLAYVSDGVSKVAASDVVKILQKHGMPRLASGTDVVLLDHSLLSLVHAYNISKRVARTMRHNQLLYAGMNGVQLVLTSTRMASPLVAPILVNSSLLMRIHDAQRLRVWRDVLAEWPDSRTVKEVVQDGSN